jgi:competence protein ComEC
VRSQGPPDVSALLAALAVGDQRFISDDTWDRLRSFGLTHLLVISGLHISLTAVPGWWLGGLVSRALPLSEPLARCLPVLLALVPVVLYALLAGLTLPTRRALLMLCCLSLPRLAGRRAKPAAVFAVAVAALVLLDPLALLGPSFWLSVGAVGLLLCFVAWRPMRSGLRGLVPLQLFLATAMLPMSLFWFGSGAGPGSLLNLVAIPLVSFVSVPALLIAMALSSIDGSAGSVFLGIAGVPLGVIEQLMRALEAPLAQLPSAGFFEHPVALGLAMAACLVFAWRPLPGRRVLAALLAAPLLLPPIASRGESLEVVYFDVGQGTAVLLRSGVATLLYDTGPGPPAGPPTAARTVLPALRRARIDGLDALVVSHDDRDHSAGETLLQRELAPRRVLRGASRAAREQCRSGREEQLGASLHLRVLSGARPGDSDNNGSCVLLVEAGGFRFLLPGDIDAARERDLVAYWGEHLRADVLLAAHHGSGASSSRLFLRHADPDFVVVTRGYANPFGHPARRVVDAVRKQAATLLDTARDGAVVFRIDQSGTLRCRRLRHRLAPFWRRGDGPRDCSGV